MKISERSGFSHKTCGSYTEKARSSSITKLFAAPLSTIIDEKVVLINEF
jgi:hypothetical protein